MKKKPGILTASLLAAALCLSIAPAPALAESTASESDAPYQRGTLTAESFESEWLNLRYTPASYMIMSTEEEVDAVMNAGKDLIEDSSGMEINDEALTGTVYEMMAASASGYPNVSLIVEAATMTNMTSDQYLGALQDMLDATQLGYEYNEEPVDITIAGQEFRRLDAGISYNGYDILQSYCVRRQGDKFVAIILSYTPDTTDQAGETLDSFTALSSVEEESESEGKDLFHSILDNYTKE
ncbi:MAG: hypothetical protein Q4F41_20215 [Eubacteriales bacterium]|nr:hypothetical protein [Eubacteriales bacterium]